MRCILFLSLLIVCCTKEPILFIQDTGTLPKLEIIIDDYYLWSPDSGLYVIGTNGTENCGVIANYNQNWEYPAQVKYLENNSIIFDEKVGLRIKGNCSRALPMKSFGLYWREIYEAPQLNYPIFINKNLSSCNRLFLRNSGGFYLRTHLKDISIVSIIKDYANVEYQEYIQAVVYLNNEYWGIYNIREMITPHFFENNFGVAQDNIDLLEVSPGGSELSPTADDGSINGYINTVINFIQTNDLSDDINYNHIKNIIDIDNYIDYIIINTYIGNWDWPGNNIKWWKDRTNNSSKWRWILFDMDAGFDLKRVESVWIGDLFGDPTPFPVYENDAAFYLFNSLLKNLNFKQKFLNRYLDFIENVFNKDRVASLIYKNKNTISTEYPNFQKKWNTLTMSKWENEIDKMITFNNQRNDIMKKIIEALIDEYN